MAHRPSHTDPVFPAARPLTVAACLACFCLIWFRLDFIGLDQIEVLHVVASTTPVSYLLGWTSRVEVHPPTFYLLLKGLYFFFGSDFGVKSFLALFSFGVLYYGYRIAENHSKSAAALTLALLAVNPALIEISRSLRPHTMVLFFMAASLHWCIRYARTGTRKSLVALLCFNMLGMALHYMFAIYLVTQAAILLAMGPGRSVLRRAALAAGLAAVSFLPVASFYFTSMHIMGNMALSGLSYTDVALRIVEAYTQVLSTIAGLCTLDSHGLTDAGAALLLAVLAWMAAAAWKRRDGFILAMAFVFAFPAVFLLASRHGFVFYKYIPQSLLALCVLLGALLAGLGGRAKTAAMAAIIVSGAAGAAMPGNHFLNYRTQSPYLAETPYLAQDITAGSFPAFLDDGDMEAFNHYYGRSVASNLILDRTIRPGQESVSFMLVGREFFQENLDGLTGQLGQPARTIAAPVPIHVWDIPRQPVRAFDSLPASFTQTMRPGDFLAHVHSLDRMMFYSNFGEAVAPTRIGVPGTCDFVYENRSGANPRCIALTLDFDNLGEQDTLVVRTRFDQEPESAVFGSLGSTRLNRMFIPMLRDKPFTRLTVSVEIVIRPITPKYPNWNHGLTRLKGFEIGFSGPGEPANTYPASFNRQRMKASYTADLGRLAPLNIQDQTLTGLEARDEGGERAYATGQDGEGHVDLTLTGPPMNLVLFPRVSGNSSVVLYETTGGQMAPLFQMYGVDGEWSPMQEGYNVLVPPGGKDAKRTFRVVLSGRGAQLWQRGGALLHAVAEQ